MTKPPLELTDCKFYIDALAAWMAVADELAHAIQVGNDHGYGLRIGDDAMDNYKRLKELLRVP